jgi:hypothetical protein
MQVINQKITDKYSLYNGDSCEIMKSIPDNSIHYSIFSPPFASLYVYSDSECDMGNCKDTNEFYEHFRFIVQELYRVLITGRVLSFHCMNLPTSKQNHGYIGIQDFRGDLIRLFQSSGFIYHSEVVIWKDPVIAMQRTKALGLLNKQKDKDATMSRQGIPDYVITMRKPGENPEPVKHNSVDDMPIPLWQEYASPIWEASSMLTNDMFQVWFDINPSNTLQKESAREEKDEKHICPLQLEVIKRCVHLWSNPNDIVFTPFAGIGSEVYQSLKMGRRGIGIELKESYYKQAVLNCENAANNTQLNLF